MERKPNSRSRKPWEQVTNRVAEHLLPPDWRKDLSFHRRNVHDGTLHVQLNREPLGPDGELRWHLSISHRDHRGDARRYPTWDEIAQAREELLPDDLLFAMMLPPSSEYVAVSDNCFHLHEIPERET